jgi:hypothetical protein
VRQYVASLENQNYHPTSDGRSTSPATARLVGGRPLASFIGDSELESGAVPPPPPMMSATGAIPRRTDPNPDPVVTSPPASARSRAASTAGSVADPAHLVEQGAASLELQQAATRPHRPAPPPPARTTPLWQGEPSARAAPQIRQRLEEIRQHIDLDLAEAESLLQVLKS